MKATNAPLGVLVESLHVQMQKVQLAFIAPRMIESIVKGLNGDKVDSASYSQEDDDDEAFWKQQHEEFARLRESARPVIEGL